MAIARIAETQVTPEQYDQMRECLGAGDTPPPGCGIGEDGEVRIVELWDSRDRLRPGARRSPQPARKLVSATRPRPPSTSKFIASPTGKHLLTSAREEGPPKGGPSLRSFLVPNAFGSAGGSAGVSATGGGW